MVSGRRRVGQIGQFHGRAGLGIVGGADEVGFMDSRDSKAGRAGNAFGGRRPDGVGSILPQSGHVADGLRGVENAAVGSVVRELQRRAFAAANLIPKVNGRICNPDALSVSAVGKKVGLRAVAESKYLLHVVDVSIERVGVVRTRTTAAT